MTTTTSADCPQWCEQHLDGVEMGVVHQRRIEFGDAAATIELTTGADPTGPDPTFPIVTAVDFDWISDGTIREYAEVLNRAADLLGIPALDRA